MAVANRLAAKRDKKAREQKKKAKQMKQEARDRGKDMSSDDDDDDDDDDDEVVVDVDWGVLEDEDTLTSAHPSVQGPFPFHTEGSRSVEARESASSHGVPAEDRWMGDGGLAAADPKAIVEGGGTGAAPGFGAAPCEVMEGSSSGAAPRETMEGDGSGAAPDEMNPPTLEQGAGMKRSCPDESG